MIQSASKLPDDAVIPAGQCVKAPRVAELLDISVRTLYRKVASGDFPKPVRIGKGTTRWRMRDIESFLNRKRAR
jgi:predicted DNA-binding transcriptional regulator AlpA